MRGARAVLAIVLLAIAACGPAALTTEKAHDLIAEQFPESEVSVDGLRETDAGYVVRATAGGYDGQFTINHYDTGWQVDAASTSDGGPDNLAAWTRAWEVSTDNPSNVEASYATMITMRGHATNLGVHRIDYAEYPARFDAGVDGWDKAFRYRRTDTGYTMISDGGDGTPGTPDDIIMVSGQITQSPVQQ